MKLFNLTGKIALITGSTGGLGFTFARGLAQAGATVVINSNDEKAVNNTVNALQAEGFNVHGAIFDVRDSAKVNEQIIKIEREVGAINILINNAGVQSRHPLEKFPEKDWREIIDVNLTGAFIVSKAVVQGMIKRKSGKIINVTSLQSEISRETIAPYAASKGGLKMLTRAMTVEWAKYNIQVNGIGPGYFITEMTGILADSPDFDNWLKKRNPSGRWGKPEELMGTIVYLSSDASNFVSGQVIYVDGGLLAAI